MSDWFYAANNEQKGPVNESELKASLATGKLTPDTLVWKDGMDNWTAANQVPAFMFRQPPTPAKIQPPVNPAAAPVVATKASPTVNNPSSTTPVDMSTLVGTPESLEVDPDDAEKNKFFGIIAYLWIFCLIPIIFAKDSPFAKYHANQGLVLFLLEIILSISLYLINIIIITMTPSLGFIVSILGLVHLGPLVLLIFGIINAAAGKCVPLPVIGGIKLLK
jgi:uncharacterized membrane protein